MKTTSKIAVSLALAEICAGAPAQTERIEGRITGIDTAARTVVIRGKDDDVKFGLHEKAVVYLDQPQTLKDIKDKDFVSAFGRLSEDKTRIEASGVLITASGRAQLRDGVAAGHATVADGTVTIAANGHRVVLTVTRRNGIACRSQLSLAAVTPGMTIIGRAITEAGEKKLTMLVCSPVGASQRTAPEATSATLDYGGLRHDVMVSGRKGLVILPRVANPAGGKPWVWYAPTLMDRLPGKQQTWLFTRLLENGFAVVGVDVGESQGNPEGRAVFTEFYKTVREKHGLDAKACLLPQSRGGLMHYNWAAEHPECVQCIGGIYPVYDQRNWPRLDRSCKAYGMTEKELAAQLAEHNPIDRLAPLAQAKIPILHLHGDADTLVPLAPNSAELARRYRALGGPIELVIIKGGKHQFSPAFFENQRLLDFLLSRGKIKGITILE